jgi:hypothetical protein
MRVEGSETVKVEEPNPGSTPDSSISELDKGSESESVTRTARGSSISELDKGSKADSEDEATEVEEASKADLEDEEATEFSEGEESGPTTLEIPIDRRSSEDELEIPKKKRMRLNPGPANSDTDVDKGRLTADSCSPSSSEMDTGPVRSSGRIRKNEQTKRDSEAEAAEAAEAAKQTKVPSIV